MKIKIVQTVLCLVFIASYVYQSGKENPRMNATFAALWGMLAGAYLTEILEVISQ